MTISETRIKKFREIYLKYFKKEISLQEAQIHANNLIRLVKVIHEPMTKQEFNEVVKHWEETMDLKKIFEDV